MNSDAPPAARRTAVALSLALGSILCAWGSAAVAGKVETWKLDSAPALAKGKRERVVVSDAGVVRLARGLQPTESLDALRVWDLARTAEGAVYAATGDAGKVFRREGDGPWAEVYDSEDSQALALAVGAGGHVFVGSGPSGGVVDLTDPAHPSSRPDPSVRYIWDLAADARGTLYAATGPAGGLWKRPAGADEWALVLDSKHAHLLSVAVGPDGSVYAGSDGEGIIYRIAPGGKASVVYDAPQSEVRALLVAPDGVLYAGTAAESGGGSGGSGGSSRGVATLSGGDASPSSSSGPDRDPRGLAEVPAQVPGPSPRRGEEASKSSSIAGGSASPRPPSPGDNAVYRIGADGVAREVFRARAMVYALAWQGDRLLVGTGPEGQLVEVRDLGREASPIARLDRGQVLALLAEPGGDLLLGAGDPGAVVRLGAGYSESGTLTSEVHDAKFLGRFGALTWRADLPPGTSVSLSVRTGNVGEPDETWSGWSAPQTDPASARAEVPPGRFAQIRATLATTDPAASPELRSVSLRYQTVNLPPEIAKLEIPDLSEGDGAARQTKLTLKWDVSDPNGDDLEYTLHIRKEGWPDWVTVGDKPITEKQFAWDTTAVPAGVYRLRLSASDRPSNDPGSALDRDRVSDPFLVDHEAPTVGMAKSDAGVKVTLRDGLTRLVKAAYALDGGDWVAIFPEDGLFDTASESITVPLPNLKPGTHVLTVRATDAAGNAGAGDLVIRVP